MAVILVADVGATNANSYCTDAEALVYHQTRFLNSVWEEAEKGDREKVLMWATRLMDQLKWRGYQVADTQALRWPRGGCNNREGYAIDSTSVPNVIKEACAEWAFYLLTEDRTLDEGGLVELGGKVGPISNAPMYARKAMPDGVRDMLAPFITSTAGAGRVTRV
jgi:hypothetical protein